MGSIVDPSEVLLELGLSASVTEEERAMAVVAIVRAEGAVKRYLKYDPLQRTRTEFYPQANLNSPGGDSVWTVEGSQAVLRRSAEAAGELQIQHIPIRSITSLHIDYDGRSGAGAGAFPAETLKTEGVDFWPNYDGNDSGGNGLCRDGIIRSTGGWPTTPGTVRIVYVAGYSLAELHGQDGIVDASPIGEAIVDEAVRRFRKAQVWKKNTGVGFAAGPFTSEKLGDYAYTIDSSLAKSMFGGAFELVPETQQKLQTFVNYGW